MTSQNFSLHSDKSGRVLVTSPNFSPHSDESGRVSMTSRIKRPRSKEHAANGSRCARDGRLYQ